ncbi:MAG TPA: response regulator transcription factor [Ktedonobacterales bacterium]
MSNKTLRIFLADDHPIVREGLKALVNAQPDMQVVGDAADGYAVVDQAPSCQPDIIMMDISMPGMNGIEATARLRRTCPDAKILALSVHEDASYVREVLSTGASGYVLKRTAAGVLVQAIRAVAAGGIYLDPAVAGAVVSRLVRHRASATETTTDELSEREAEVVRLVALGHTNKEIATRLAISVKTVETYKGRAMEKLGLQSRAALVRYAVGRGWLQPS